jgi:hypothetical protein
MDSQWQSSACVDSREPSSGAFAGLPQHLLQRPSYRERAHPLSPARYPGHPTSRQTFWGVTLVVRRDASWTGGRKMSRSDGTTVTHNKTTSGHSDRYVRSMIPAWQCGTYAVRTYLRKMVKAHATAWLNPEDSAATHPIATTDTQEACVCKRGRPAYQSIPIATNAWLFDCRSQLSVY